MQWILSLCIVIRKFIDFLFVVLTIKPPTRFLFFFLGFYSITHLNEYVYRLYVGKICSILHTTTTPLSNRITTDLSLFLDELYYSIVNQVLRSSWTLWSFTTFLLFCFSLVLTVFLRFCCLGCDNSYTLSCCFGMFILGLFSSVVFWYTTNLTFGCSLASCKYFLLWSVSNKCTSVRWFASLTRYLAPQFGTGQSRQTRLTMFTVWRTDPKWVVFS